MPACKKIFKYRKCSWYDLCAGNSNIARSDACANHCFTVSSSIEWLLPALLQLRHMVVFRDVTFLFKSSQFDGSIGDSHASYFSDLQKIVKKLHRLAARATNEHPKNQWGRQIDHWQLSSSRPIKTRLTCSIRPLFSPQNCVN